MNSLEITPLGFAAGAGSAASICASPSPTRSSEEINKAWLEHIVLVFPEQELTPEEQIAFSRRFGVLDNHDSQAPSTLHPDHRGDPGPDQQDGRRQEVRHPQFGPQLAHRPQLHVAPRQGRGPSLQGEAAGRRRHDVRQPLSRARDADAADPRPDREPRGAARRVDDPRHRGARSRRRGRDEAAQPAGHPPAWSARIPRPAASRCWSTSASAASSACPTRRARACSRC